MIERKVNFERLRGMRCGSCSYEWKTNDEWLDLFNQGEETCPSCGTDCQVEERPNFWAPQDDPSYDDTNVLATYWYHTSTHSNWPDPSFDHIARLSDQTKQRYQRISTDGRALERWAQRQTSKALHLGTYESAIENMLRRMKDQDNSEDQFYLYRVQLCPVAAIEPGVHNEPTNWVGDVQLAEICSPGIDVFRYVNTHEDPSSISIAVNIQAIHAVQRIPIPLTTQVADPWVHTAAARLLEAAQLPTPQLESAIERLSRNRPSALSEEARQLKTEIANTIPVGLRRRLHAHFDEATLTSNPRAYPAKLKDLAHLIRNPTDALQLLNSEAWRTL